MWRFKYKLVPGCSVRFLRVRWATCKAEDARVHEPLRLGTTKSGKDGPSSHARKQEVETPHVAACYPLTRSCPTATYVLTVIGHRLREAI
jgi:hypothetical protein